MTELFGLEISLGCGVFPGPCGDKSMEHVLPAGFVSGLQRDMYACVVICFVNVCGCVCMKLIVGGMCWQKKWLEGWPASGSECTHWLSYYCVCCPVWVTAFLLQMDFQCETGEMA